MRNRYFARSDARQRRPAVVERAAGGCHGQADVLGPRLCDLGERLFGGGADGRVPLARARLDPLAADVQPVPLRDGDDVARLRGRRVVPPRRDGNGALLLLELSQR